MVFFCLELKKAFFVCSSGKTKSKAHSCFSWGLFDLKIETTRFQNAAHFQKCFAQRLRAADCAHGLAPQTLAFDLLGQAAAPYVVRATPVSPHRRLQPDSFAL